MANRWVWQMADMTASWMGGKTAELQADLMVDSVDVKKALLLVG
jgi:hypothetical protein